MSSQGKAFKRPFTPRFSPYPSFNRGMRSNRGGGRFGNRTQERTQQGLPPGPSSNPPNEAKRCDDCGLTTHLRGSRLCEYYNPDHNA
eukprot:71374-Pelagomonas_calceolata.AAC.1